MLFDWFQGFRVRADEIEVVDGDSIHWRRGGWPNGATDGTRKFRLEGYDAPEIGERAKSAREAEWAADARAFLRKSIDGARKLSIRALGMTRFEATEVAVLYIDGRSAKSIMIEARMGMPAEWSESGHMVRPKWDQLERWPGGRT